MTGEITIVTPGQSKSNGQVKATTIGGKYTVGDTRTKPTGYIKIVSNDIEKWQAGFDKIDIAPKNGELSLEEICAYRDKQVQYAKFVLWTSPKLWFNFEKQIDIKSKIRAEECITEKYRGN